MKPPDHDSTGIGIGRALALSVVVHLLALVVAIWLAHGALTEAVAPALTVVRFTLEPDPPPLEPEAQVERPPETERLPIPNPEPRVPEPAIARATPPPASVPPVVAPAEQFPPSAAEPAIDPGSGLPRVEPSPFPAGRPGEPPSFARPRELDLASALAEFRPSLLDRARQGTHEARRSSEPREGSGIAAGSLEFGSRDFDLHDYQRLIEQILLRAFNRRLYQTVDQIRLWAYRTGHRGIAPDQVTSFDFAIERNGAVTGARLVGSSGCEPLDRVYLDALAEVILPPLPGDFPRERETWKARWGFRVPVDVLGTGGRPAQLVPIQ